MSKTILVTGSSRGIGKAVALMLAEQGFDIVLHCRSNQGLALEVKADIESLGRSARVLQFDVADRAAV
ncbi:MAG: SDR family NAD(P)-dependent oxidoreductase, partial [Sinobacterium sp.]|nr:SDR family NAD(P)-dependent oxidoreductase [Sinobacterium sp.]